MDKQLMQNKITSLQNPKVKEVVLLQEKAREREKTGLFPVEGLREVSACISSGFEIDSVFLCDEILQEKPSLKGIDPEKIFSITPQVYEKIAYRSSTEGILALAKARHTSLSDLGNLLEDSKQNPLILVAEAVEKPGNLGAILRTADAVGATAVIFANPRTDLYNPNLIRASLGGVFTQKIVCCKSEDAIDFLKARNIKIYTAQLQDSVPYYGTDMTEACAIALGSEADGISNIWREASDRKIIIPMLGRLDSLNVSVSASILCYEALRQRTANQQ
ncbi:MAG: RNA methyltransferase [Bacteroidales bacterium]|nr:RNA methyltransferase [Bacteroidales bacterium]